LLFSNGENPSLLANTGGKALLPLEKGEWEGFLARPFSKPLNGRGKRRRMRVDPENRTGVTPFPQSSPPHCGEKEE